MSLAINNLLIGSSHCDQLESCIALCSAPAAKVLNSCHFIANLYTAEARACIFNTGAKCITMQQMGSSRAPHSTSPHPPSPLIQMKWSPGPFDLHRIFCAHPSIKSRPRVCKSIRMKICSAPDNDCDL
jgi:hypothetical protein